MRGLKAQAPHTHDAVDNASRRIGALEKQLATAKSVERAAQSDSVRADLTAASAAATPAAGPAAADAARAKEALLVATGEVTRIQGELTEAWGAYRTAKAAWDRLLVDAGSIQSRMHDAATGAQRIIDDQKSKRFSENPSGIAGFFSDIGKWLDDHASLLSSIADLLIQLGSLLSFLPGIGMAIGLALAGIGVVLKLALAINGNIGWGEFAMSAVDAIPGAGKAGQLGKLGKEAAEKAAKEASEKAAKEASEKAAEKAARKSSDCTSPGHPVDIATGAMVDDWTDLTIGGVLPLVLSREYSSRYDAGRVFGDRWCSLLDVRVEVGADEIAFIGDEGQVVVYPAPVDGEEVLPEFGTMPLSFADGATGSAMSRAGSPMSSRWSPRTGWSRSSHHTLQTRPRRSTRCRAHRWPR